MSKRLAPAVGLFLLAPLVAEFLLGNLPITMLASLLLLAPMYGGGALLIREVARRAGGGRPMMLVLGGAYAVLEEGLVTQSLFNPDYAGAHLLDAGFVPALGLAIPWTLFVLTLHVVWSIATPIALVESFSGDLGPWLRTPGLVVTGVLFAVGVAGTAAVSLATYPFVAPWPQLAGAGVVVLVLVAAAFALPRRAPAVAGAAPAAWVPGLAAVAAGGVFMGGDMLPDSWSLVTWTVAVGGLGGLVGHWSRGAGWGRTHVLALAAGAVLTYAWHAFVQTPVVPVSRAVDLAGDLVWSAVAAALLVAAAVRVRRATVVTPVAGTAADTVPIR